MPRSSPNASREEKELGISSYLLIYLSWHGRKQHSLAILWKAFTHMTFFLNKKIKKIEEVGHQQGRGCPPPQPTTHTHTRINK